MGLDVAVGLEAVEQTVDPDVVELDGLESETVESDAVGSYMVEFDEVELDAVEPVVVLQALMDRYVLTCCMPRVVLWNSMLRSSMSRSS